MTDWSAAGRRRHRRTRTDRRPDLAHGRYRCNCFRSIWWRRPLWILSIWSTVRIIFKTHIFVVDGLKLDLRYRATVVEAHVVVVDGLGLALCY
jgi:hypothetical protein